ncbi:hypothetical protein ACFWXH_13950 [Mesorhizobium sp. NPDC059054]|uniref:hypothetical protein n=1 Tax=Mesorhizobium sp. NPDC059054 TaxID=3346711 RepID=UPI003691FD93
MNADWLISPHHGIGRLAFGLSPEAVAALASLYGEPGPLMSQADVADDVEAVIAQQGASMSEETIAAVRRAARELANFATQNLTKGQIPILLEYRDDRLDGVTVEARHKQARYDGKLVFALGAREVLSLFERANGAPGRYRSSEAAFDNIAVSLFNFTATSPRGEVRALAEADADFRDRSVTLRRQPYRPADELDQFVTFSFN